MLDYLNNVKAEVSFLKSGLEDILKCAIEEFSIKTFEDLKVDISKEVDDQIAKYKEQNKKVRAYLLKRFKKRIVKRSIGDIAKLGITVAYPEFIEYNGMLYANEKHPIKDKVLLKIRLAHEIGHFYLRTINPKFKDKDFAHLIQNIFFAEGLSTYLALEILPLFYKSQQANEHIKKEKDRLAIQAEKCRCFTSFRYNGAIAPYAIGYEFFKTVLETLGKDHLPNILANPPTSVNEFYNPQQYLNKIRKV